MANEHDFRRDRRCNSCHLCFDLWPSGEGLISKFNTCSKCNLGVHSSCTAIAKQCYSCEDGNVDKIVKLRQNTSIVFEGYNKITYDIIITISSVTSTTLCRTIIRSSFTCLWYWHCSRGLTILHTKAIVLWSLCAWSLCDGGWQGLCLALSHHRWLFRLLQRADCFCRYKRCDAWCLSMEECDANVWFSFS